jgi:UDP-N-acetylglucosamine 2-epimerase (non-hydrolysing)
MKIMTVVGARPNFMKAAPIVAAVKKYNTAAARSGDVSSPLAIEHLLVHTGQHYDKMMSDQFFADLNLPRPDTHLEVGSASHAVQTAEIMRRFEDVLRREKPDVLIVVGDVNSTLACALVAAKLGCEANMPRPVIAHVEAGLRSFDRTMPEEINRIVTDQLSDLLFVTEESGLANLHKEGIPREKIFFVGNTMIDSLLAFKDRAESSAILRRFGLRHTSSNGFASTVTPYALLTLHRPANVDDRGRFTSILEGMAELVASHPVIFPVHPRTRKRIQELGLGRYFDSMSDQPGSLYETRSVLRGVITLTDPLGYLDCVCLMKHAVLVVTDSGGIQEETTCLGTPCVTVRENTERPVTVTFGTNVVAGTKTSDIRVAIRRQLDRELNLLAPEKWDGKAATRILDAILGQFSPPSAATTHRVPAVAVSD